MDGLIIIDRSMGRVIARAQVDNAAIDAGHAVITWFDDPVAQGWLMQNIGPLKLDIPNGIVAIHEKTIEATVKGLVELLHREEST